MTWLEVRIVDDSYGIDKDGLGKARIEYYVEADSVITAFNCLTASAGGVSVKLWGQSYSTDAPGCRANDVDTKWITPYARRVIVQFADPTLVAFDTEENLLAKPAVVNISYETLLHEYTKDRTASTPQFVRNTAGEPFEHGPERMQAIKVFSIEKFLSGTDMTAIEADLLSTNPSTTTILGRGYIAGTSLLFNMSETPVGSIWKANVTIKAKWDKWTDPLLNVGYSELVSGHRKDITQKDANGKDVPICKPWPLNSDGTKKSAPDATPDELTFLPYAAGGWTWISTLLA